MGTGETTMTEWVTDQRRPVPAEIYDVALECCPRDGDMYSDVPSGRLFTRRGDNLMEIVSNPIYHLTERIENAPPYVGDLRGSTK